jgi:hypothetical protein
MPGSHRITTIFPNLIWSLHEMANHAIEGNHALLSSIGSSKVKILIDI